MNRVSSIAVYFAAAAWTFGASSSFDFTVAAGRHDRSNVPVRVPMPRGQIGKERIASVTLARPDGQLIPAQWTGPGLASSAEGELHFVLPHLKAGESVRLKATLSTQAPPSTAGFTWRDHPGHHTDLLFGERRSCRITMNGSMNPLRPVECGPIRFSIMCFLRMEIGSSPVA